MSPELTDAMRAWLRHAFNATLPMRDGVLMFMAMFGLSPEEAGRLLAEWIKETT